MNVYEYASNPNQRFLTIKKSKLVEGEFSTFNNKALSMAMNSLSYGAMKLYIYLSMNSDGFAFWFSKSHFCKISGLSKRSYFRAFEELYEKGYITTDNKAYVFHEIPVG